MSMAHVWCLTLRVRHLKRTKSRSRYVPRPPRVDFDGAWHHVMNRGAGHQAIFLTATDYAVFFDCLDKAAAETATEIHGYCLMTNHYHLLVRSPEARLSEFLKLLSGRYTTAFNKSEKRDGPLFRGRAYSVLIRDNAQLVQTSRYIHLNPVVSKLSGIPEDWQWSSARAYLNVDPPAPWLFTRTILEMFDQTAPGGNYESFLRDGVDLETEKFYSKMHRS
jgi:putative transposase